MEAKNGRACLKILEDDMPDLILLDVMMTGEDGWEVCRKIKEDEKTKAIPVVMFTVCTSEDAVGKSLEYARADAQINKPFRIEELLKVVGGFLKE